MKLLVKKGRVLDPGQKIDGRFDLLLVDGLIAEIKPEIETEVDQTIQAEGLLVVPGFIDLHVHLREPGYEHKETIASGNRAAARGGFTTVCCMPNTNPVVDSPAVIHFIQEKAAREALVNVLPVAAVSLGQKGQELAPLEELQAAGAVAFSDDGQPVWNSALMRRAMEEASRLGVLLVDHCEEKSLAAGGVINEGRVSRELGLPGIPAAAEEVMVARDIILARDTGWPVHLAHLSSAGSVELLAWARASGIPVSAEVTPHHLLLTEDSLLSRDPVYKVNPPLRTEADRLALLRALKEGWIEVVATDHAPHSEQEKSQGLDKAPFGINGLETAVPSLLDRLVRTGQLPLERLIEALTTAPARLLRLEDRGLIKAGARADLTLLDLEGTTLITRETFQSKSSNTPFMNSRFRGSVATTIVAGRVVYPFSENK
ncbi:MAG: dihydroorotase [Candidatus Saccharicenans sp.]|nr:dihydroorotase [Candidatus Saccharicenans sp.]MDH7492847.1 dihydroorotase [Candidatus Saccharicenans sp.]